MSGLNSMGSYNSTFYSLGSTKDFSLAAWEKVFVPFDREGWIRDRGGSIQYTKGDDKYSLIYFYNPDAGIALFYDRYNRQNRLRNFSYASVSERELMHDMQYHDDGSCVPKGAYVSPDLVWLVTKSFLTEPTEISAEIEWIDSNELPWPE